MPMTSLDYLKLAGAGAVTVGALATAAVYYTRPDHVKFAVDMDKQSAEIPVSMPWQTYQGFVIGCSACEAVR